MLFLSVPEIKQKITILYFGVLLGREFLISQS